jgi:hypothetical protein
VTLNTCAPFTAVALVLTPLPMALALVPLGLVWVLVAEVVALALGGAVLLLGISGRLGRRLCVNRDYQTGN